eukprot:3877124-Lingulodinium_polyedra.AAC.1
MERPWVARGQSMDSPWAGHGQPMDSPWTAHGQPHSVRGARTVWGPGRAMQRCCAWGNPGAVFLRGP